MNIDGLAPAPALEEPMSRIGWLTNAWLIGAIAVSLGLQACAVYVPFLQTALQTVPLGWQDWGLMALLGAPVVLVSETVKWHRTRPDAASNRLRP